MNGKEQALYILRGNRNFHHFSYELAGQQKRVTEEQVEQFFLIMQFQTVSADERLNS